jgi:hypothetical protein
MEFLMRTRSDETNMAVTIKISRSDGQWTALVPKAKGFVAWSPSLKRLRRHVDVGLREFYPELATQKRREIIDLPAGSRRLLEGLARAERQAMRAQRKVADLRQRTSCRLRAKLRISVREVGDLMGLSGARVQQLIEGDKSK